MTVFHKETPTLSSGSVIREREVSHMDVEMMTEWRKVVEMDHHHAGKLSSKHDSNDDKLLRSEEREDGVAMDAECKAKKLDEITEDNVGKIEKAEDSDAKPSHSYIALIAMAILSKPSKKVLLGDIYNYISDKFPYYRTKDKSWRNSIRHNLSLNECFIKAGRSENGKGNYWAIHPANLEDFANGDFRRRRARRRVRKTHSTLCSARYTTFPFPQHAYMNYRSAEFYHHHPFYLNPFSVSTCVRKNSFAIENLLSSQRVPSNPMEYSGAQLGSPPLPLLSRAYPTTGVSYTASPPGIHTHIPFPPTNSHIPITESWTDTWRKLKARFQPNS